jgi:hypothetical protein
VEDLESRLRKVTDGPRTRTAACPDEHEIAGYVDGTLPAETRGHFEEHLAGCDACLALIGFLSRDRERASDEHVSELALARARSLIRPSPGGSWARSVPQVAAAAAVLLALSPLLVWQAPGPTLRGDGSVAPETRSATPQEYGLQVVSPLAGAAIDAGDLTVRWKAVPGSRYYAVRIVSETGELITEERTDDTEWQPSRAIDLSAGGEYYVQVDAYPADSKAISSDHVAFRVSPRP